MSFETNNNEAGPENDIDRVARSILASLTEEETGPEKIKEMVARDYPEYHETDQDEIVARVLELL